MVKWQWFAFGDLSVDQLYEALWLRQDVFIVEQACVYNDLDGYDQPSMHLFGRDDDSVLVAYLRILPPGTRFEEPSIGRVITKMSARGAGLGKELMLEGIRKCGELYPGRAIRIAAQQRLQRFYENLGFHPVGVPYDEDGILHIEMLRPPTAW